MVFNIDFPHMLTWGFMVIINAFSILVIGPLLSKHARLRGKGIFIRVSLYCLIWQVFTPTQYDHPFMDYTLIIAISIFLEVVLYTITRHLIEKGLLK